ncbi:hypothetical protein ACU639_17770 [Streptomyces cynarae]|uniref:hypothetical protein n=1 Tax=Streptomyces cynarae TaxID=2981134 RepID=UPI00406CA645
MAKQRFVAWYAPTFGIQPGSVTEINLEPDVLRRTYPELAKALGRGRIISHHLATHAPIGSVLLTFVVEDD